MLKYREHIGIYFVTSKTKLQNTTDKNIRRTTKLENFTKMKKD